MTRPRSELADQLEAEEITLAPGSPKLLAEEATFAYKDVDEVVRSCEGAGLACTVAKLRPIGIAKG